MVHESSGEIILYQQEDGAPAVEVRLEGDTVWVTQAQLVELFQSSKANISEHIRNVFDEGEVDREATVREFRTVRQEGSRRVTRVLTYYNLDVILSVGYRVRSKVATQFRIWASQRLHEYLVKGFTMDDAKLKNLGGGNYWRELLERIRDIRSSEKVLYRQVLDLYATSIDYNPKAEVSIAKNYLSEVELRKLNTLVSAYFDAAEFRAQNHQTTYMKDWLAHLDRLTTAMDAPTLTGAGSVSHKHAVSKAEEECSKYRAQFDSIASDVEGEYLESLKRAQREVERK